MHEYYQSSLCWLHRTVEVMLEKKFLVYFEEIILGAIRYCET